MLTATEYNQGQFIFINGTGNTLNSSIIYDVFTFITDITFNNFDRIWLYKKIILRPGTFVKIL